jgi:putative transposase
MPARKMEFVNDEVYHITMRGVDGRDIFVDDEDRWHGIFGLYEFNREESVTIRQQRRKREILKNKLKVSRGPASANNIESILKSDLRTRLVDIIAFVFMPNHLHLLLRQLKIGGITDFSQKFNTGHAMYFNFRHQRKGTLFQGRFNARHIDGEEYFKTALVYIHANPISLIEPNWKEKGIIDPRATVDFLENYRWSSYLDYIGKNNFPSVTQRDSGLKIFAEKEADFLKEGGAMIRKFTEFWIYSNKLKTGRGPASANLKNI